jgi:hypothetical protein
MVLLRRPLQEDIMEEEVSREEEAKLEVREVGPQILELMA